MAASDKKVMIGIDPMGVKGVGLDGKGASLTLSKMTDAILAMQDRITTSAFMGLPMGANRFVPKDAAFLMPASDSWDTILRQTAEPAWGKRQDHDNFEHHYWDALKLSAEYFERSEWPTIDLKEPRRSLPPHVLNLWLWGPYGEFVALPRVPAFGRDLYECIMSGSSSDWVPIVSRGLKQFNLAFEVKLLADPRNRPRAVYAQHLNDFPMCVRFRDYEGVECCRAYAHAQARYGSSERQMRDYALKDIVLSDQMKTLPQGAL